MVIYIIINAVDFWNKRGLTGEVFNKINFELKDKLE